MIKSSNCAIFSDIHIGVHRDSDVWHKISLDWARWFKAQLDEKNIKDVIFCGDFFHYRDSIATNTLHQAGAILDLFKDLNIVFVPGNHDCYYKDSADINSISILNGRDNITVVDKVLTYITDEGKKIVFVPWGTAISDIPECDIMFGHFEIHTFKLNNFKICDHGIEEGEFYKRSPLTISGHFHLRSEREINERTILYVGNPFQMDFGDLGDQKGIYFIDLNKGEYTFKENTVSPTFHKLVLSEIAEKNLTIDQLSKIINNNIVKLVIDKKISTAHADFLFKQIRALCPRVLDIEHDINFNLILGEDKEHDFSGIDIQDAIKEFINIMEIGNKEPVINYVLDLYKRSSRTL